MNPRDTFLQAVLEGPGNDAPRLDFAGWLDDLGDPRGDFIRVQCLLARLPDGDARQFDLERREHELLAEHERDWAAPLAELVDLWVFRRGFVEEIGLSAERFLRHSDEIFRLAPIQEVHLTRAGEHLGRLAESPYLSRLRFLDLSNNALRDHGVMCLAHSPYLGGLGGLNLSCTGMGDGGAESLAASPHLGRLAELYLSSNRIGNAGGRALAFSPRLRRLTTLHLAFNALGQDGEQALARRFGERVQL